MLTATHPQVALQLGAVGVVRAGVGRHLRGARHVEPLHRGAGRVEDSCLLVIDRHVWLWLVSIHPVILRFGWIVYTLCDVRQSSLLWWVVTDPRDLAVAGMGGTGGLGGMGGTGELGGMNLDTSTWEVRGWAAVRSYRVFHDTGHPKVWLSPRPFIK